MRSFAALALAGLALAVPALSQTSPPCPNLGCEPLETECMDGGWETAAGSEDKNGCMISCPQFGCCDPPTPCAPPECGELAIPTPNDEHGCSGGCSTCPPGWDEPPSDDCKKEVTCETLEGGCWYENGTTDDAGCVTSCGTEECCEPLPCDPPTCDDPAAPPQDEHGCDISCPVCAMDDTSPSPSVECPTVMCTMDMKICPDGTPAPATVDADGCTGCTSLANCVASTGCPPEPQCMPMNCDEGETHVNAGPAETDANDCVIGCPQWRCEKDTTSCEPPTCTDDIKLCEDGTNAPGSTDADTGCPTCPSLENCAARCPVLSKCMPVQCWDGTLAPNPPDANGCGTCPSLENCEAPCPPVPNCMPPQCGVGQTLTSDPADTDENDCIVGCPQWSCEGLSVQECPSVTCTKDLKICPDGTPAPVTVGPDGCSLCPDLANCASKEEEAECPKAPMCTRDLKMCADGTVAPATFDKSGCQIGCQDLANCAEPSKEEEAECPKPPMCTRDLKMCADGTVAPATFDKSGCQIGCQDLANCAEPQCPPAPMCKRMAIVCDDESIAPHTLSADGCIVGCPTRRNCPVPECPEMSCGFATKKAMSWSPLKCNDGRRALPTKDEAGCVSACATTDNCAAPEEEINCPIAVRCAEPEPCVDGSKPFFPETKDGCVIGCGTCPRPQCMSFRCRAPKKGCTVAPALTSAAGCPMGCGKMTCPEEKIETDVVVGEVAQVETTRPPMTLPPVFVVPLVTMKLSGVKESFGQTELKATARSVAKMLEIDVKRVTVMLKNKLKFEAKANRRLTQDASSGEVEVVVEIVPDTILVEDSGLDDAEAVAAAIELAETLAALAESDAIEGALNEEGIEVVVTVTEIEISETEAEAGEVQDGEWASWQLAMISVGGIVVVAMAGYVLFMKTQSPTHRHERLMGGDSEKSVTNPMYA